MTHLWQARKLAPRGMVLVEWEPDLDRGEKDATLMWLLLDPRPGKWNGDAHRAWRFHPAEPAKRREKRRAQQPAPAEQPESPETPARARKRRCP